jgi:hypothetical protein
MNDAPLPSDAAALYAPPRVVTDLADCAFYHTMDLPGYGTVPGEWDLRPGVEAYLGGVPLRGKRVLEVGTANGFLCFHMERQGADVVAYDLSERDPWDMVPFARLDPAPLRDEYRTKTRRLNNAWWLAHRLYGSRARLAHGTVYDIPEAIGPVDVATLGCVLLHLRDPFLALARAVRLARETAVVTEVLAEPDARQFTWGRRLGRRLARLLRLPVMPRGPCMTFLPHHGLGGPRETWWVLPPELICRFLAVLGFEDTRVGYHTQLYRGARRPLFTVVGRRTVPAVAGPS